MTSLLLAFLADKNYWSESGRTRNQIANRAGVYVGKRWAAIFFCEFESPPVAAHATRTSYRESPVPTASLSAGDVQVMLW
jgi:hypothetical protein